jgi:hypothetical protein
MGRLLSSSSGLPPPPPHLLHSSTPEALPTRLLPAAEVVPPPHHHPPPVPSTEVLHKNCRVIWKCYLKHNGSDGVRMNREQADALQRPLERHLILLLLPPYKQLSISVNNTYPSLQMQATTDDREVNEKGRTDLAGLGFPYDLDGGLLGVLSLPRPRLGPVHGGQHDSVSLRPARGTVGAVKRVAGAGEGAELIRVPPVRAASLLHLLSSVPSAMAAVIGEEENLY